MRITASWARWTCQVCLVAAGLSLIEGNIAAQTASTPEASESSAAVEQPMPSGSEASSSDGGAPSAAPAIDPATGQPVVKAAFSDAGIDRIITSLAQQSGKNVAARGKVAGQRATLITRNVPLERALDMLVNQKPNWLVYKPEDQPNTYELWDQESFRAEVLPKQVRQKYFVPQEITAEEAHKAITGVLTPNIGSAAFDPRSNKLFVTDLPYVLELVQRLIEQIDVKFMTHVFYIRHADVNSIAEKLANLKSPAAPAPEVDERTHQIIVRDRLDIIRQMELLVETLDKGPELRVYDLNNVGFEGQDLQIIEEAITEIITPDAFMRVNPLAGKMIVEDVEEVHEKIEKILQAFDQPPKQVLVQAEIIETEFKEGFNYSIDYKLSGDLFSSVIDGLVTGVPDGSETPDRETLGFLDFREEFPVTSIGAGGLDAQNLSRHAFIRLQAAMSDTRTRILQQPRLLVKNQEIADFSVGQKIPFFTGGSIGYPTTGPNGQVVQQSGQPLQQLLQVGLDLSVSPTINNNGLIELEVEVRNNTPLTVDRQFGGETYTGVGSSNQELATTLVIPSGETRVIGGLLTDGRSETKAGVPYLIRIPVLGPLLFGSINRPEGDNRRRNLLIFLTPSIVLEKPRDVYKYKGRTIVDESAIEEFPVPEATVTDVQCDPVPVDFAIPQELAPLPQLEKGSTLLAPPASDQSYDAMSGEEANPMTSLLPPTDDDTDADLVVPSSVSNDELLPLQRVRVEEQVLPGGPAPFAPRGPSGALTGAGTAAPAGATPPGAPAGTTPAAAAAAATPRPTPVPQPAVVAPAPAATPAPAPATPAATPAPPPAAETKF